jgi:DnaJ-class molecular chaperone
VKNPYEVLGVAQAASQDEIRSAYRKQARKFHPDLNPGNKEAENKFKDLSNAYELIGTPETRAKFDRGETAEQEQAQAQAQTRAQSGAHARRSGPFYHETQQGGGRYSEDFFESFFRNAGQGSGARAGSREDFDFPGEDRLYQMSVDFRDAILGAQREITLPGGKRLQVKIPAGVENGTKLRFKGQGEPGTGKAPAGDAYVEITVRALDGFTRSGNNVETELPISFLEALAGTELQVKTLDGTVLLKIPSGVSTGSRLRIRGRGVRTAEPGDQIVILKVVMPRKVDPALAQAARSLAEKFPYDARSES